MFCVCGRPKKAFESPFESILVLFEFIATFVVLRVPFSPVEESLIEDSLGVVCKLVSEDFIVPNDLVRNELLSETSKEVRRNEVRQPPVCVHLVVNELVEFTNRSHTLNNNSFPEGELQEEEDSTRTKLEDSSGLDVKFEFIEEDEISIQNEIVDVSFVLLVGVLVEKSIGKGLHFLVGVVSHDLIEILISGLTILGNPLELDPGEEDFNPGIVNVFEVLEVSTVFRDFLDLTVNVVNSFTSIFKMSVFIDFEGFIERISVLSVEPDID